jgi:hypothetical protein
MAAKLDPAQILYGPPLPPAAPPKQRAWGYQYIFDPEVTRRDYVIVEEVIEDSVGIVVSPWPHVDEQGGLEFPPEEERREALVDRESFETRLVDRKVVAYEMAFVEQAPLQGRALTPGDVFAIATDLPPDRSDFREWGSEWIHGDIVDITAMARDAAKAAMFAALAGEPLSLEEAEEIAETPSEEETPPEVMER